MRFEHPKSFYFSTGVFFVLFAAGVLLSQHKLLWIDECWSQHVSVEGVSYTQILTSRFNEGNKSPLFYLCQKAFFNLISFHYPQGIAEGSHDASNALAQIVIRIPSNVYMSLALAVIFYFFTRFFSLWAAFYAMATALVTPMVWMYWVEARPYSLWFLLTTVQLLLLSCTVIVPRIRIITPLLITHLLLAFTVPASIFQITIALFVLLWKGKYGKLRTLSAWVFPVGIALLYYFLLPVFRTKTYDFWQNLFEAVMPERLFVYVLYALTAWVLPAKYKAQPTNIFFLPVFLLFFASGLLILAADVFTKNSQFGFFSRYLIFVTPADILMFCLASFDARRWSRANPWICMNVSIFLGGLLVMRGLLTWRALLAAGTYLHAPYWGLSSMN